MQILRKALGLFILTFIGLPSLIFVIWTVVAIQTLVSPSVISDVPIKLINQAPQLTDSFYKNIIAKPELANDLDTRIWMETIAKQETTLRQLLEQTGIYNWLNQDIKPGFNTLGQIMRQEIQPQTIQISMNGYKQALQNPQTDQYLQQLFNNLPECNQYQEKLWNGQIDSNGRNYSIPACNPGEDFVNNLIIKKNNDAQKMQNTATIYEPGTAQTSSTFLAFTVPMVILLLGSLFMGLSLSSISRWNGIYLTLGAFLSWLSGYFLSNFLQSLADTSNDWQPLLITIIKEFNSHLTFYSAIIAGIGILLIIISFLLNRNKNKPKQPETLVNQNSPYSLKTTAPPQTEISQPTLSPTPQPTEVTQPKSNQTAPYKPFNNTAPTTPPEYPTSNTQ